MKIEIYTLSYCPYCNAAKDFFDSRDIKYTEYKIEGDEEEEFKKLRKKFDIKGEVTAPQIIIDNKRIGGYTDLIELYNSGKLSFPNF